MLRRSFLLLISAFAVSFSAAVAQERRAPIPEPDPFAHISESDVVVVLGGSGRSGRHLVQQLHEGGVTVRGTTRDVEKANAEVDDQYDWVAADVTDPATLTAAFEGATYVISAIGNGQNPEAIDYQGVVNAVDAAKAQGVQQFVLISSAGVTHEDHYLNKVLNNVLIWKGKAEEHLRQSGLAYTIVRPTGLREDVSDHAQKSILMVQGDWMLNGIIDRADVARICIAALGNEDAHGKTLEVLNVFASEPHIWRDQFATLNIDN